jgi:hypothetical protein
MNALKSLSRALMTFAMIAGLMLGASMVRPNEASAAGYARITLHVFECGAKGGNLYDQCHNGKHALEDAAFRVAGVTRYTDAYGHVSWGPGAGYRTIAGYNLSWGYYDSYVYCSNQVTGAVLYNGLSGGDDYIAITTTAGQQVVCDWYYLY